MLETIRFINNHRGNWRDLLKQPPYCLTINEDADFAILKYSQIDSDFNEQICRECRGLIIDLHTIEPAALSFYKFFNYGEQFADKIYWKQCRVQEKIDGSKMMVWFDKRNYKWRISTSSQLDAYKANVSDFGITFGELFDKAVANADLSMVSFYGLLNTDYCYTFELVSPESRVVIPYKKTKLYFTGLRKIDTFEECDPDLSIDVCKYFKRPKEYQLPNLKSCLCATEHMGYDEEGFVVVDSNWKRIKVKSPAYVAAHYLRNNGVNSRSRILSIIEKGEQEEFLNYFPEYKKYFEEVENAYTVYKLKLRQAIDDIQSKIETNRILIDKWDQKEFAKYINTNYPKYQAFLFQFMKTDLLNMFIDVQWQKLPKDSKMNKLGFKMEKED